MLKIEKLMLMILVSVIVLLPGHTYAESYINENGIEISEEEYADFLKLFTPEHIMFMSEEEYERMQDLDFDNLDSSAKYVISTYNPNLGITTHQEVSELVYNNFNLENMASPNIGEGAVYRETTAKRLALTVASGSTWSFTVLTANWKYVPVTRSFDTIGLRGDGFSFRNGSQTGEQLYYLNGSYQHVDYSWNGTNIKKFDNGFGISMNLVNPTNIESLVLTVTCDIKADITHPEIFGSYQHAITSLTLANSQNYTLSSVGLGGVFAYPYSISSKLDGMSGVAIAY